MLRHGRPISCGTLLPDVIKLICGTEGEKIVTNGRPTFPSWFDSEGDDEDKRKSNEIIDEKLSNTKSWHWECVSIIQDLAINQITSDSLCLVE